jgi:hypothetical protein
MPILDPAFREQLRAKRMKAQAKELADLDILGRDASFERSADTHSETPGHPGDDPDDVINPDDSGPQPIGIAEESDIEHICALPVVKVGQMSERGPGTSEGANAAQSASRATAGPADIPAPPALLDPAVVRTMPERVIAFMLYEPRDPPAWRYRESECERAERQALENLGAWTG